jgi:Fe-S oxidoreductase
MGLGLTKKLAEAVAGIDARRQMPPFALETFERWFAKRRRPTGSSRGQVALFHDCFLNYNYPQVGRAATEALEAAGFEVILPEKACCGRPAISKGLLDDAKELAAKNVSLLERYAAEGIPLVGCEPSCLLTLRDEYPDMVQGDATGRVASNAWLIDEFLVDRSRKGELDWRLRPRLKRALVHGHCHQKAHLGTAPTLEALRMIPGCEASEINSGCCGMAGSFGFEKEHYDLSEKIGRERLFPAVEAAEADTEIVVTGVSCRQQIGHFTSRRPRHVIEVLREAID